MHSPVHVALLGCGDIAGQYLTELTRHPAAVRVVACADTDSERARTRAAQFGVPRGVTPEQALADETIELCVNLTPPLAHAAVTRAALAAGKHVYSEKPLATDYGDGAALVAEAARRGLRLGCAPDTFLAPPIRTAAAALGTGMIGRPVAAFAAFAARGHEAFHPAPAFFFAPGGGPTLDMGPYYVTALVELLGPIAWVSAQGATLVPERDSRRAGRIVASTFTHVSGTIGFVSGALATVLLSFDVHHTQLPRIEVYGTGGSLRLPDPNLHAGAVELILAGGAWDELPQGDDPPIGRGYGVVEMALALRRRRPHRASAERALHVLEALEGLLASAEHGGVRVELRSGALAAAA